MKVLLFCFYSLIGVVHKEDDGLYTLRVDDCVYEYVYKEEIFNWIETKEFQYNDFLVEDSY
jgi:hypothetical protein